MENRLKFVFREAIWLLIAALLSIFLAKSLFAWTFFKGTIDMPLHDTYFVFSSWQILLLLFLFVTFVIYFIKEINQSFSRIIPNWITIITGITLVYVLTILIKISSNFKIEGWTAYPPLTAVPQIKEDSFTDLMSNSLIVTQLVILIMLLYVSYRCGIAKKGDIQ